MAGLALAHRSGRPALSSVRGLRAGAGGGEEGGKQRPRQGGVHPARARGMRGTLLGSAPSAGREPPAGHRGSSGAQGSRREMLGARWGVAGCPCRTWGSLWGGAPSVGRGGSSGAGPLTRARSRVGQAPEFCERAGVLERVAVREPRQGPGVRGAPRAVPRSRGKRGISGYAGHPGRARVPGVRGAPGGAQWDKCGGGRGGAGVGSEVPGCPRARLRGAAGGRAAAARAPPCCSAAGREGERRAGERRGAGPGGGLGPPGGGGEDPARGAGGRGRGGPGRAAGSRSELGARARRGGVCRAWQALAGSALALSLVPSHARGGRRSPQQPLPNFPNFPAQLFPLLPCLRLPPPPSPFPSPALRWAVAPERHRQRASGLMLCSGDPRLRGGSPMVRQLWGGHGPASPAHPRVLARVISQQDRILIGTSSYFEE